MTARRGPPTRSRPWRAAGRVYAVLGFAKERQRTRALQRADELAGLVLQDWRGNDVRLGDLWRERPALLVFLRHYG